MNITLIGAGKKFYREWIFRKADLSFSPLTPTAILGPNGSGKSTLLQVIAGAVIPTEGSVTVTHETRQIPVEDHFQYISFVAPYLELIEEFTLREIIHFHFKFKKTRSNLSESAVLDLTGLSMKSNQEFRYFSSGMKQRVKLALAFLSDTPVLLLDEPCSNLDANGIAWYNDMVRNHSEGRTVVVASNQVEEEYAFCTARLNMIDIKK